MQIRGLGFMVCGVPTTYLCCGYIYYIIRIIQQHVYAICSRWYMFFKNPTTYSYDFCSAPWHIWAADTISNLTLYNVIPIFVIISLESRHRHDLVMSPWLIVTVNSVNVSGSTRMEWILLVGSSKYRALVQNIVLCKGLFCKRDQSFNGSYWPMPPHVTTYYHPVTVALHRG